MTKVHGCTRPQWLTCRNHIALGRYLSAVSLCFIATAADEESFEDMAHLSQGVRLVAFDLDGTLVRGPTICESLAEPLGKLSRMREFEQLRDLTQIRAARQEMLGWYGDAPQALYDKLSLELAPGAAEAFDMLAQRGVQTAIVSITWGFAVERLACRLGADAWVGTGAHSGEIQHFWPDDKPLWLARHADALGITMSQVAAIGDSYGDVPMLAAVGHPFFVGAALPRELAHAVHAPSADMREIAQLILAR
jgi:HAD superfamily phosphoserine phosphatase-like hydrolase